MLDGFTSRATCLTLLSWGLKVEQALPGWKVKPLNQDETFPTKLPARIFPASSHLSWLLLTATWVMRACEYELEHDWKRTLDPALTQSWEWLVLLLEEEEESSRQLGKLFFAAVVLLMEAPCRQQWPWPAVTHQSLRSLSLPMQIWKKKKIITCFLTPLLILS